MVNDKKYMRILHLESENYSVASLKSLKKFGELDCLSLTTEQELDECLNRNQYNVIIISIGFLFDSNRLKSQTQLKYIISPTTGLNHIDLKYCEKADIKIISLKGEEKFLSTITSTAEHTWSLLLALTRNVISANQHVVNGGWDRTMFLGSELYGKTIGIIGYGRLGKIVSKYAAAFGMKQLIYDISNEKVPTRLYSRFEDVLSLSDVIVLLASYSDENNDLIGLEEIKKMKPGCFFINTSRGEMLDENALIFGLENGIIRAAALDVLKEDSNWKKETPKNNSLIAYSLKVNNLLITPHIGGYGESSIQRTRAFIIKKFIKTVNFS
jgi:D-3-phosphoglycerate dehydrogenase